MKKPAHRAKQSSNFEYTVAAWFRWNGSSDAFKAGFQASAEGQMRVGGHADEEWLAGFDYEQEAKVEARAFKAGFQASAEGQMCIGGPADEAWLAGFDYEQSLKAEANHD